MPKPVKPANVNDNFFNGCYKEIWRSVFPEKTTLAEIDFIIETAALNERDNVLDIMCGYGRHTLEMARRGMSVTAIDNLKEYIDEITEKALEEKLPVEARCEDVLSMQLEENYDTVICMGNSLQFFDEEDLTRLLTTIAAHLKPNGFFFINSWSIAEILFKNFKEKSWSRFGDKMILTDSKINFRPARMETQSIIITAAGEREEKTGIDYIYSINELESILNKSGFSLKEVYSIPGKKVFSAGDPRAYIIAQKIS
jgi:cyclopropane fatty-acyl-phospholipid synthase-like methyltransferase